MPMHMPFWRGRNTLSPGPAWEPLFADDERKLAVDDVNPFVLIALP